MVLGDHEYTLLYYRYSGSYGPFDHTLALYPWSRPFLFMIVISFEMTVSPCFAAITDHSIRASGDHGLRAAGTVTSSGVGVLQPCRSALRFW
jgi:hypothetical protein